MADEKFRAHVPSIIAAAGGTVLASIAGSYLGIAGTLGGLIGGSVISGSANWWIDRGLRKSAEKAKAKANFKKRHGREPNTEETQVINAVAEMQVNVKHSRGIPWKLITSISAAVLCVSLVTVIAIETIAHRSPAQVIQGHGVTLSGAGSTTTPQPSYSPSAVPTYSPTAQPTPLVTPSPTPSATITVTPTITPSVTPTPTTAPSSSSTVLSGSPSPTPSFTPIP